MEYIDLKTWKRKKHFEFFKDYEFPYFNVCVNVDITNLLSFCKKNNLPFFRTTLFLVMKSVNEKEELRLRIRKDDVVLHDEVHPGFTVLGEGELYSNCISHYYSDYNIFLHSIDISINNSLNNIELDINTEKRDDLVYISCVKWLTFTSIEHPIRLKQPDSVPRIVWGKYFEENSKMKMPFALMAHHSLLDGFQVSEFYNILESNFKDIEKIIA